MMIGLDLILLGFAGLASLGEVASSLYTICLIVGGGMLLISVFFSFEGSDVDVDDSVIDLEHGVPDADGDVMVEPHGHSGLLSLSAWLSMRFLIYFAAVFGMMGMILSKTTGMADGMVLGIALGCGIIVGQIVQSLLRTLCRNSGNTVLTEKDYINRPARVSVAIAPGRQGEVAVLVKTGERFLPAMAKRPEEHFPSGEIVGIIRFAGGIAEVVSRKELEFLKDEKGGITE